MYYKKYAANVVIQTSLSRFDVTATLDLVRIHCINTQPRTKTMKLTCVSISVLIVRLAAAVQNGFRDCNLSTF